MTDAGGAEFERELQLDPDRLEPCVSEVSAQTRRPRLARLRASAGVRPPAGPPIVA